ncbi:MAG: PP2C family protein-serine/threonine phosphatase [Syntrophobacteraceae bacterium]
MSSDLGKSAPTILIIDDEPVNVRLLEAILKVEGYATICAYNGPTGRELALDRQPDLILLDVMMAGESGFETCGKLKQDPRTADIPVIFVSALDDVNSKVTGLEADAVDYITKPLEVAEVVARTKRHLKTKTQYKKLIEKQANKLEQIHRAQQSILVRPEDLPAARFAVAYLPLMEAGGDFYDVFQVREGVFGYFVADVSGHDIGAAYATSALKVLLHQQARSTDSPAAILHLMNRALLPIMKFGSHVTACCAFLDRSANVLTVVSAGHPPIVHLTADGVFRLIGGEGDILGAFENVFFETLSMQVAYGDRLFMFTDGVIEWAGGKSTQRNAGLRELIEECITTMQLPVAEAVGTVVNRLLPNRSAMRDDLLLIGVQV